MCFSANASFTTAALAGAVGVLTLRYSQRPCERPLAAVPLVFAAQQALEGLLWLDLPGRAGAAQGLSMAFLLLAQVFWPTFAPFAVWAAEPQRGRRRLMVPCLLTGSAVSALLLTNLLDGGVGATAGHGHIIYETQQNLPQSVGWLYLLATALPPLLSSQRAIIMFGLVVLSGSAAAYLAYEAAFQSVWCFFAAAGSVIILAHFVRQPRRLDHRFVLADGQVSS